MFDIRATLASAVDYGRKNTKLYEADDYPELPVPETIKTGAPNDPEIVARAWHAGLAGYRAGFDLIEFAIYCREHELDNYDAFYKMFIG